MSRPPEPSAAPSRAGLAVVAVVVGAVVVAAGAPEARAARGHQDLTKTIRSEIAALKQLDALGQRVTAKKRRDAALRYELKQLDDRLAEAKRRIHAFETRAQARKQHLKRRMRALYKLSRGGLVRLMLEADSAALARRHLRAITRVVERDASEVALFARELQRLHALRDALERQRTASVGASKRVGAERAALVAAREQLQRAVAELRRERLRSQRRARTLSTLQRRLVRTLQDLRYRIKRGLTRGQHSFAAKKGKLPRPARGAVVSRVGKHAALGVKLANSGIVLRTRSQAPVHAVADGRVAFAGPMAGFGRVVLVDHGEGYFTLSGYLASVTVARGQTVAVRTPLGRAGVDPLSGKPALYFEVRHHRRPLDPTAWLGRR